MTDRPKRRRRIADLIGRGGVGSQERLRSLLERDGIAVTQATLSRDLREMRVVKGPGGYALAAEGHANGNGAAHVPTEELEPVLAAYVVRVEPAGTMVVLHTGPGRAPVVALEIDRAGMRGVVGTVAGDDTVFVASHSVKEAAVLTGRLRQIAGLAPGAARNGKNGGVR